MFESKGSVTVQTPASIEYVVDASFQSLSDGETGIDSFTYVVDDGQGGSDTATVNITITGEDDAAVVTGDVTGSVIEAAVVVGTSQATGDLDHTDVDAADVDDVWNTSVVNGPTYGTFSIVSDGQWIYNLDDNNATVNALTDGQNLTDAITVETGDGTQSVVNIAINGSNDAPEVPSGLDLTVTDNDGPTSLDLLQGATDVDSVSGLNVAGYVVISGDASGLTLSGDTLLIDPTAYDALNVGDTESLVVEYVIEDGDGGATTQVATIQIDGANDAAVIAGVVTGTAVEDGASATGTLTASDVDNTDDTFTVQATVAALYGSFSITVGGAWIYAVNNADPTVDALTNATSLTDSFTVTSEDGTAQTINVTIQGADDALNLTGTPNPDALDGLSLNDTISGLGGDDTLRGLDGDDSIEGGAGVDLIGGGNGSDTLSGGTGGDAIYGGGDNDVLIAGAGNDSFFGGGGVDLLDFSASTDGITVDLSNSIGNQFVSTSQGSDRIQDIENVAGTAFADLITGNAQANRIIAGAGNDTVDGGQGDDTLDGGAGVDTLTFAGAAGGVTVDLSIVGTPQALGGGLGSDAISGFENLFLTSGDDNATGDAQANVLTGADGNDTLSGLGGSDTLIGGTGNDSLSGGDGDDVMVAGAGNDTFDGGLGNDAIDYGAASEGITLRMALTTAQLVSASEGTDVLIGIENVIGTGFNDAIFANSVANLLLGGTGNDRIYGGGGDDTMIGGGGVDDLNYFFATGGVTVNLGLAGTAQTVGGGQGTDTFIEFENVLGSSAFDDDLTGNSAANLLEGYGGNDTLRGAGGNDTVQGGAGNDLLGGGNGNDVVRGDQGNDAIYGGGGNDTMIGGSEGDLIFGGGGEDTFVFELVSDSVLTNRDTLADFVTAVDHVDLSLIDANNTVAGDQAFNYLGNAAFAAAGDLRFVTDGTDGFLIGDVDGDGAADLNIRLLGVTTWNVTDLDL